MTLSRDLIGQLKGTGFHRASSDTYLREPNAEGIEHAVMLEELKGVRSGIVNISAAVRHQEVETCLGRLLQRVGLDDLGRFLVQSFGWTMSQWLGAFQSSELTWESVIRRPDGAALSIARMVSQLDRIITLRDIHQVFLGHGSGGWLLDDVQAALRHLIVRELLLMESRISDDPSELSHIERSLERAQEPAYAQMLSSYSLDDLRGIVQDILRR